jgi:hypothetical protein
MLNWIKIIPFLLLGCHSLLAAPVGNTSFPDLIQKGIFSSPHSTVLLRLGYEGDFVSNGRMNQESGRVDLYEQWTSSGTVTLDLVRRLDLYGVFGASATKANWRFENDILGTITRIKVKTEESFLWAVGARAILIDWRNASLGLGGRYTTSEYGVKELTSNGSSAPTAGAHMNWQEWQVNVDASYKIRYFTPYIGAKYSEAKAELRDFSVPISSPFSHNNSFHNRSQIGLYLGCTISSGKYFMLNLEGRLLDEEAVTVSADFGF